MAKLTYKMIPEGMLEGKYVPLNIAFIDYREVKAAGITPRQAFEAVAKTVDGPVGMNIFDPDVVTTTSDGVMVEGTVRFMAAADKGKMNHDLVTSKWLKCHILRSLLKKNHTLFSGRKIIQEKDFSEVQTLLQRLYLFIMYVFQVEPATITQLQK